MDNIDIHSGQEIHTKTQRDKLQCLKNCCVFGVIEGIREKGKV